MKNSIFSILVLFITFGCGSKVRKVTKPNIIYILADYLGYGEVGAYGQEKILTPNIDKLAKDLKEENNVAAQYPEIVEKIKQIMEDEHEPSAIERFQFKQLVN